MDAEYTIEGGQAYCHYCPTVLRRSTDPIGLLLAIHHHIDRKH